MAELAAGRWSQRPVPHRSSSAIAAGRCVLRTATAALVGPLVGVVLAHPAAAQGESLERLFLNDFEARLTGDPFFENAKVHLVDEEAPLALYTQNPPAQRNKTFYVPWMKKLREKLERHSLRSLGLRRRSTHAVTPVLVLANETSLRRYQETRSMASTNLGLSVYDEGLRAVVCCESSNAAWLRRQPVLRDLALGILDAHGTSSPSDLWFRRGYASYVSYHTGSRLAGLDEFRADRYAVEYLFGLLRRRERKGALWIPLERLMSIQSLAELSTEKRGDDPPERVLFDQLCALWLHFLYNGEEGRYREGATRYLGAALRGEGGWPALEEALGTRDAERLDKELERYVFQLYDELFVERVPTDEPEEEEPPPPADIDLSALVREPEDDLDVLALALWNARHGRFARAIEAVERRASEGGDGAGRLGRELARLKALNAAREGFLTRAVESRERTRLLHRGGKVTARLAAIEDGVIRFADAELVPLPVEDIDSVSLALSLGDVPEAEGGGWIRSYGLALGGDKRWKRFLRASGAVADELEQTAPEELPALVQRGRALGTLNELGRTSTPHTPEEASAALDTIEWVLAELTGEQRAHLDEHEGAIAALARRALELRFLEDGVASALRGSAETLEGGRLRLTYDFSDESQIEDFEGVDDYLKWRLERLRREFPRTKFKVYRETLRGTGFHCLRHRLRFQAPMSVSYEFELEKRKSSPTDVAELMVGICDDGEGSYLGSYAQGELHVEHKGLEIFDPIGQGEEPTSFRLGYRHEMEIRHDGEVASTWRGGELRQETPVLGLDSGYVFLWAALTGMLRFDNIVIEGTPDPKSLAELREAWVRAGIEALGLSEAG